MSRLIDGPLRDAIAIAILALGGAAVHREALMDPRPRLDEQVFLAAASSVAAGGSPYEHPAYNYPPFIAAVGGRLIQAGGQQRFLAVARGTNLVACGALVWLAASTLGVGGTKRLAFGAILIAVLPNVRDALWRGNLAPIAIVLAVIAWKVGLERPAIAGTLQAMSLWVKPVALMGVAYLVARRAVAPESGSRRVRESLVLGALVALFALSSLDLLPDLAQRMSVPPVFSSRNLSLRGGFATVGLEIPATGIALGVVGAALWLARRRPCDLEDRLHVAPVVSLLALPVSWSHGFLLVLPLQIEAARIWWDRRAVRAERSGAAMLAEAWGVPLALAAIQASAATGVEIPGPQLLQLGIILIPVLAPLLLLSYRLRFGRSRP